MNQELDKPKVNKYTLDPYSARVFILKLEQQYGLTIRVCDSAKYCMICIDKKNKDDSNDEEEKDR